MVPCEVVPSPQLMVAAKALGGSSPLAWVKVAVVELVRVRDHVLMAPETLISGSAIDVVLLALLLPELGSGLLVLTEALSLALPSSIAWAVTDAVTVPPGAMVPMEKVRTPPD